MSGHQTSLTLHEGEDWKVIADTRPHAVEDVRVYSTFVNHHGTLQPVPAATLRRIGWLDQKGRVYSAGDEVPHDFDGGSLTPLLIDARED